MVFGTKEPSREADEGPRGERSRTQMSEILEQAHETNGHGTATPAAGMKRMAAQKTSSPAQGQHNVAADNSTSRLLE
jgi:hypothetical protein